MILFFNEYAITKASSFNLIIESKKDNESSNSLSIINLYFWSKLLISKRSNIYLFSSFEE